MPSHAGAAEAVRRDHATLDLHAQGLEAEVLGVADHADGGDHPVGGYLGRCLPLPSSMVAAIALSAPFLTPVTLAPVRIVMPSLLEALAREGRDLGILDGQNLRQHLDHRYLGAHGTVER